MVPGVDGDLTLEYLPNIPGAVPARSSPKPEQDHLEGDQFWGEGGGLGSGLGGTGGEGLGSGEGVGSGAGWGMVIDAGSEDGEIEEDNDAGERYGLQKQVEDDDAY